MVDIPASSHSQWHSGFIIAMDSPTYGVGGPPRNIPESQTETDWLKMSGKSILTTPQLHLNSTAHKTYISGRVDCRELPGPRQNGLLRI